MNSSNFIKINGYNIHYLKQGEGNSIVFLHGILTHSCVWRNIIPKLSKKAMCIAPDLIGMGKSDKPQVKYGIKEQLKDFQAFIEKLELKNITLVLHGFGSIVGFNYAMHNPSNIRGIAFYEPHLHPFNDVDKLSLLSQELRYVLQTKNTETKYDFLINRLLPNMTLSKLDNEVIDLYHRPFINGNDRKTLLQIFEELYLNNYTNHIIDEYITKYSKFLQNSFFPKLLLYSNPGFNTSMATVKWCQNNLPNIKLADLEDDLHLAQESNHRLFSTILLDWYENYISKSKNNNDQFKISLQPQNNTT